MRTQLRNLQHLLTVQPDYDYARGELMNARLYCCDWRDYVHAAETIKKEVAAGRRAVDFLQIPRRFRLVERSVALRANLLRSQVI